jgi:hypothetical protein
MNELEIEQDIKKFRDYLNANGAQVLSVSLMVEIGSGQRVCTLGNSEMVSEMAIVTIAGMNGLRTTRDV